MFHRMVFNRLNGQSTKQLKALLAAAILGICIVLFMTYVVKAEAAQLHEHPTVIQMLKESNKIREQGNFPPHVINSALCKAAQNHAVYMAKHQERSHSTNKGYKQRAKDAGYKGIVAENIGYGQITITEIFRDWKNSPGHYSTIISRTKNAGFGLEYSRNGTPYWVGVYGY